MQDEPLLLVADGVDTLGLLLAPVEGGGSVDTVEDEGGGGRHVVVDIQVGAQEAAGLTAGHAGELGGAMGNPLSVAVDLTCVHRNPQQGEQPKRSLPQEKDTLLVKKKTKAK